MQFSEVISQLEVKQHLVEMLHQNRLSHALLFLGKEGSGALPLALAFAQYITCEKVSPKTANTTSASSLFGMDEMAVSTENTESIKDSCGICASCLKSGKLIHPDIHFSYPGVTKKSGEKPISTHFISEWRDFIKQLPYGSVFDWLQSIGAENKQGNITAEECNDIIHKLSLKSFESEYKILILWMPEYLGREGNKLLKLIEEPPANTLFILVAQNEAQILPTILSRCQLIKIPALEPDEIEAALISRSDIAPELARQTASLSEGNYHQALQLLQHAGEDWQATLREWLNVMLKTGPLSQVKWVEEISGLGREKQKQFLRYFNHMLQQTIRLRILNASNLPENEKDFAQRLNKITSVSQQQCILEELDKATYYIERNCNAKMLFMALTLKLCHIIQDKTLFLTT